MRKIKKLFCLLLMLVIAFTSVSITDCLQAEAAAGNVYVQSERRCGVGMRYYSSLYVRLVEKTDTIKNIKVTNSKKKKTSDLVAKVTSYTMNNYSPYAYITFYAKKAGTYKISFDVYKSGKKKRTSRTVKVYASGYGSAISSVTFNGKQQIKNSSDPYSLYTSASSAKVKFTMAKGYKIKKIKVHTKDQNGNDKIKAFKNGKKVTFCPYGSSSDNNSYWAHGMFAATSFEIIYTDSFAEDTTEEYSYWYTIYKPATKYY